MIKIKKNEETKEWEKNLKSKKCDKKSTYWKEKKKVIGEIYIIWKFKRKG